MVMADIIPKSISHFVEYGLPSAKKKLIKKQQFTFYYFDNIPTLLKTTLRLIPLTNVVKDIM